MPLEHSGYSQAQKEIIFELERNHGAHWQIWIVNRYQGGPVYCARLWSDARVVINDYGPDDLAKSIENYKHGQ